MRPPEDVMHDIHSPSILSRAAWALHAVTSHSKVTLCGVIRPSSRGRAVSGIATGGVPLVKYQPFLHLRWSYGDHLLVG